mgnify:CR=1 FL=1
MLVVREAPMSKGGPIEVLMVERPSQASFGGLMVFPGGALEECDFAENAPFDDAPFRIAGMRETAEEVGFVPTERGYAQTPPVRGGELIASWAKMDEAPSLDRMTLVSRWVTPKGQPVRFDTRFYLVGLEGDPEIVLDESELEGHEWVSPHTALARAESGSWQLILPTFSHLRWLSRWRSIAEAVGAAGSADGLTVIEPVIEDGSPVVRYRGAR